MSDSDSDCESVRQMAGYDTIHMYVHMHVNSVTLRHASPTACRLIPTRGTEVDPPAGISAQHLNAYVDCLKPSSFSTSTTTTTPWYGLQEIVSCVGAKHHKSGELHVDVSCNLNDSRTMSYNSSVNNIIRVVVVVPILNNGPARGGTVGRTV